MARSKNPVPRPRAKKKLESTLENSAIEYAKGFGVLSRKMNGWGFNSWPDRVFLPRMAAKKFKRGNPAVWLPLVWLPLLWVEFKREGKAASDLQADMHKELRRRGQHVWVIDSIADFRLLLDQYVKRWSKMR